MDSEHIPSDEIVCIGVAAVERSGMWPLDFQQVIFLSRDAMLARYMPSSCVRLCVCVSVYHTPVFYQNG